MLTQEKFFSALQVLGKDAKALQKNAAKLAEYAQRNKQTKFKALFVKVEVDLAYVKKLYETIQNSAYWHTSKLDQKEWQQFTQEFESLFSGLSTAIANINQRNGCKEYQEKEAD